LINELALLRQNTFQASAKRAVVQKSDRWVERPMLGKRVGNFGHAFTLRHGNGNASRNVT
jgi:hypothetical protein